MSDALRKIETLLKDATGPDREIDERIWAELNGRDVRDDNERQMVLAKSRKPPHDECLIGWIDPGKHSRNFTPIHVAPEFLYTSSLDAAVALVERVLPGTKWDITNHDGRDETRCTALLWLKDKFFEETAKAATPPLALCLAVIQAATKSQPL